MPDLSAETRLLRKPQLLSEFLDDEVVIFDPANEVFFSSNDVGAHIWRLLETPASVSQVCDGVAEEFDGADRAAIESDATALLSRMLEKGLIEKVD